MTTQMALFDEKVSKHPKPTELASTGAGRCSKGHSTQMLRPGVGTGQCVCSGCGEAFNSVFAFDRHQRLRKDGSVLCRDPASLGMTKNARGWWITEPRPEGV